MKELSFMQACRDFFGMKSGQTTMQFAAECKELTPDDRKEIAAGLEATGNYKITGLA